MTEYLSAVQAAELIGCSDTFVRKRIRAGLLTARKIGGKWRIRREDVLAIEFDSDEQNDSDEQSEPDGTEQNGTIPSAGPDIGAATPSVTVKQNESNGTERTEQNRTTRSAGPDWDGAALAAAVEQNGSNRTSGGLTSAWDVEALKLKLEGVHREIDLLTADVDHLRAQNMQQSDTMQSLTEEIKGLTIALHHEQAQRLQLEAGVDDKAEDEEPKRPGFLRRVFTGKPKRRRKQRFSRVGPS